MKSFDPFEHYLSAIKKLMEGIKDGDENPHQYGDVDPDFEPHQTNFPQGQGHPNVDKDFEKVAFVDQIMVPESKIDAFNKKYAKTIMHYIRKNLGWIFTETPYYSDRLRQSLTINEIDQVVSDAFRAYKHWIHTSDERIKNGPSWWAEKKQQAAAIKEKYPNIEEDMKMYDTFMNDFIWDDAPNNVDNQKNYPVFVSLYDISRNLGGHEEGGWWYDNPKLIESVEVTNPRKVENTAKMLYNKMQEIDIDGQPRIVVEKEKGSAELKEKPTYG